MRPLRITLRTIAVVQAGFGVLFLVAPTTAPTLLALPVAEPGWVDWLFAMMGARFLGYAVGMWAAARDPQRHLLWIDTLRNVTSAAFLPPLFVAALLWWHPRRLARRAQTSRREAVVV